MTRRFWTALLVSFIPDLWKCLLDESVASVALGTEEDLGRARGNPILKGYAPYRLLPARSEVDNAAHYILIKSLDAQLL